MRNFYAFEHRYGAGLVDDDGHFIGRLLRFQSLKDRNKWVRGGPFVLTDHFYREPLRCNHPTVRRGGHNDDDGYHGPLYKYPVPNRSRLP